MEEGKEIPLEDFTEAPEGSEEELADVPAPSARGPWLPKIYASHVLSTWGDRSWEFLVPLALAKIFPWTLRPVSLVLLVQYIAGALFGTVVGHFVDNTSRTFVVKWSLFAQNSLVVLCSIIICAMWSLYFGDHFEGTFCLPGAVTDADDDCIWLWGESTFVWLFVLLCLFNGMSELCSTASSISVERDWIVVLCGTDTDLLSDVNSVMQRIDLVCKVAAPAVLGFVLQVCPLMWVLVGITAWNILSFFPELSLLLSIYSNHEAELNKEFSFSPVTQTDEVGSVDVLPETENVEVDVEPEIEEAEADTLSFTERLRYFLVSTLGGWWIYVRHPVLLVSLTYVALYCTVLAPGGLFNAYLNVSGVEDWELGAMTGVAAVIGLIATFIQPRLSRQFGSKLTGSGMLYGQTIVLFPVVLAMYFNTTWALYIMMAMVALARFPLWGFDLVERHIMQTMIEKEKRGIVNSVESSMTNVATLCIYVLSTLLPNPSQFIYLVYVSFLAVFSASVLFSIWCVFYATSGGRGRSERQD